MQPTNTRAMTKEDERYFTERIRSLRYLDAKDLSVFRLGPFHPFKFGWHRRDDERRFLPDFQVPAQIKCFDNDRPWYGVDFFICYEYSYSSIFKTIATLARVNFCRPSHAVDPWIVAIGKYHAEQDLFCLSTAAEAEQVLVSTASYENLFEIKSRTSYADKIKPVLFRKKTNHGKTQHSDPLVRGGFNIAPRRIFEGNF